MDRRKLTSFVVGCALVVALTGRSSMAQESSPSGGYTLMQMNLCLSGFAGCYGKVAYPAGVREALARIREARPDAVTLNETCRRDVAGLARQAGYHLRFSTVTAAGRPLACVRPGGRGPFGDAVLTRAPVARVAGRDFQAQAGTEWRRWLCVTTSEGIDVCTAHLAQRTPAAAAVNDAQCAELAAVLARRAAARTVIFGGDVNRARACASAAAWTRTDASADQAPGLQGIYGSAALGAPTAQVLPARHTDHDMLLVRTMSTTAADAGHEMLNAER